MADVTGETDRAPPPGTLEIAILGPVEATIDGRPVDLGGPQQRALLALLALRAPALVPVEATVDALWPREPPASAAKVIQTYVSRLRRTLGDETIERRGPGYTLRVDPEAVDLGRFERLASAGRLAEALALWRGPALADVAGVAGLRVEAERLEELRVRALEERISMDIAAGGHGDVISELRTLVGAHPLRERLRGLLMLALYRSGRQAEALEAYRDARRVLVDELGIEPGEALRDLHAQILRQDRALVTPVEAAATPSAVLVWRAGGEELDSLLDIAAMLAAGRELVVCDLLAPGADVRAATAALNRLRTERMAGDGAVRTVAFTTDDAGADAARLARDQGAQLALTPCPAHLLASGAVPGALERALVETPCDLAVVATRRRAWSGPVAVPFGAAEHDWCAVELGAWIASAAGAPLHLVGSESGAVGRDASRTLATASLLLQRHLGVHAEPVLTAPGEGVISATADAGLVVVGLPDTWPRRGIGDVRHALLRDAAPWVALVRRGQRPGGLAPPGAVTRFSWSRAS